MNKKYLLGLVLGMLISSLVPVHAVGITVSTDAAEYERGDTINIQVGGITQTGEFLYLQFKDPSNNIKWVKQYSISATGTWYINFIIPSDWNGGTWTIHVKEGASTAVSTTFELNVPVVSPAAGSRVIIPTPDDIEDMTDLGAANTLAELDPEDSADILSEVTLEKAVDILELMDPTLVTQILSEMDTDTATAILELMNKSKAVEAIAGLSTDSAVSILEDMSSSDVAGLMEEAVKSGDVDQFSEIINEMDEDTAAGILLDMDPESGADLVVGMAQNNLNEAAKRVEAAVKKRLGETDPAKAQEIIDKIAATLENADTDTLVDIFIEIANLPATPSTVATVLEAMELTKTLDVVSAWVNTGSLEELAEVFSYMSDGFLDTLWPAMASAERNALFPYLDSVTVAKLPQMGEFQVSELSVSPASVQAGAVVTISVKVSNTGAEAASYTAVLKVDGSTEATKTVTINAGQSTTVSWTTSKTTAKTYSVSVDGLTGSFTVQAPPQPAAFTYSNLLVNPSTVETGSPVTVTVAVSNTGGQSGATTVELKVNGAIADTKSVTINAGSSTTATFTVTKSTAGTYTIGVGSLTGSFTVQAPPQPPQDNTMMYILAIGVVLVAAIGYYLYSQRKSQ